MLTFNYKAHKQLWNAVISELEEYDPEEGFRDAEDIKEGAFFREFGKRSTIRPVYDCFACEYAANATADDLSAFRCNFCPLNWLASSDVKTCINDDNSGLYDEFMEAVDEDDIDEAIMVAKQIRDVPIKEGIICA